MRAEGPPGLDHLPFVRHQVDPRTVERTWRTGGAAAVLVRRPVAEGVQRVLIGFGADEELGGLLEPVAAEVAPPDRVMVTAGAGAVPAGWPLGEVRRWHWMLSTGPVPAAVPGVVEVEDATEVRALLEAEAPDSHARPGTPGIEAWLGVRQRGRLVAVGAVIRQHDGTGHLRAVTVAEAARGRGVGTLLSAAMTRRAMTGPGVASLGVYVDNEPALRIYRGLGYDVVHSFTSGPLRVADSTTAVAPSR